MDNFSIELKRLVAARLKFIEKYINGTGVNVSANFELHTIRLKEIVGHQTDDGFAYKANLYIDESFCGVVSNCGVGDSADIRPVESCGIMLLCTEANDEIKNVSLKMQCDISIEEVCDILADEMLS